MKRLLLPVILTALMVTSGCITGPTGTSDSSNESPTAYIDSISPAEAAPGETVTLSGHGTDPDGSVVAYRWRSSLDGDLNTVASFETSSLSTGEHTIYFKVQDNNGAWSDEVSTTVSVVSGEIPLAEGADLFITNIYKVEVQSGYLIGYTIKNLGTTEAGASTTRLFVNGVEKITDTVHALAANTSVDREFTGWVFDPATPLIKVVADADNVLAETNETNNEKQVSIDVEIIYDFISRAGKADWSAGPPYTVLNFEGNLTDLQGYVLYRDDQILEDGTIPAKVLQTHPKLINDGYIQGAYTELLSLMGTGHTITAGEHFYARVGFLEGATSGNVKFRVMIRPEGEPDVWIATVTKSYDNTLRTINIRLDEYVGKKADFVLEVQANGPYTEDWAIWAEARIIR